MKANMNPEVEIDERDRDFYILKAKRILINPKDPTHPVEKIHMLVLRAKDYQTYFKCPIDKQITYLKNMNVESAELVHDPTLETVHNVVVKNAETKLREERVKTGRPRR
jgi:predicted type IV restriction endonuclease